jgi:two-component system chemotaxis response regulator CheB
MPKTAEVERVTQRDTIVVGASAGGVEALKTLVSGLPADLAACVLIVLHTPPSAVNALAAILARVTKLRVLAAVGETPLTRGSVLVARPDHHLVVADSHVVLTRGPRENGHRPAVDVLFRSAARALGPRVVGVVLSGSLDDGSAGLLSIRRHGGLGLVQDPREALQPGMPANAIATAEPEYVLPVAEMPATLLGLVGEAVPDTGTQNDPLLDSEVAFSEMRPEQFRDGEHPGTPAGLSCPDCHGPLFAIDEKGYVRYRCRVGHAWSPESLLAETDSALESALWMALRTLDEKAALAEKMFQRAAEHGQHLSARRFQDHAGEARTASELIRDMLESGSGTGPNGSQEPTPEGSPS